MNPSVISKTSRLLQGVIASLGLAAAAAATGAPEGQASVFFVGKQLTATSGFTVNSGDQRLIAAQGYNYLIEGTVRGQTGTVMEDIAPEGTTIAQLIEFFLPGGSDFLTGSIPNPSEALPATLFNLPISGKRTISGLGTVKFNLRMIGKINDVGQVSFKIMEVNITSRQQPNLGSVIFTDGSRVFIRAASLITLKSRFYDADENDGKVAITVLRTFDQIGPVSVRLKSTPGTADSSDFKPIDKTVRFADGVNQVDVLVQLKDNLVLDSPQTRRFTVDLSSPSLHSYLGARTSATVAIHDNEGTAPLSLLRAR